MARTELDKYQILDRTLTGSDFNNSIGIYDETKNYSPGDYVFWQSRRYKCILAVTGGTEGILTSAPDIATTHWQDVGVDLLSHRSIDQLVHDIAENCYIEYTYDGIYVTTEIWWETAAKLKKIREMLYNYSVGHLVTQIVTKQYDSTGVLAETLTETFTYAANKVTSMTAVLS